jgi:micrococcal nuclease
VRLIGVDTPESVASQEYLDRTGKENTEEGKSASEYTKDILADYDTVYLQSDTSDTDRYGRLLRYVWLEVPEDDFDLGEISTKMLNGILVYHGVANVATYKPDTAHQADFEYLFDHQGEELE